MDIKAKAFNNALNTLKALGTKYVIVDAEGNQHTHGDLEVATKKRTRGKLLFPRNTYKNMAIEQGLHTMTIGDVFVFDPQETKIESLRSTIISQAEKMWGKNAVTTSVRDGKIEALRIC